MACNLSDVSSNEFTDENFSFLDMELEALQSIYINELEVKENETSTTISIDLYPSTADKLDEQYVRMTLQFILSEDYPENIPEIKIRNPRGLSEEKLNSITQDLLMIAESKKGNSMLFEMIDAAKEHLTDGNRPSGECAICLHGFSENDVFIKTDCYHHFHSHCLARYARNVFENSRNSDDGAEDKPKSNELLCPMCRIPIEFNEWDADYPAPAESYESNFALSEEMVELQQKMAALYQKQVKKGGIIDIEAERNKYLLEISSVPSRLNAEEISEEAPATEDSVTDNKNEQSEEVCSPASDRKEYIKDHSKKFDYRTRNRNFNRPNESRSNNRYDNRYNKQSYNYRNYNKYRYGKHNPENSYQNVPEGTKDSSLHQDLSKHDDSINSSPDIVDDAQSDETSEYPSPKSKSKYNPNFSPRYNNRGYRHGRGNYNNYDSSQRSDKSGYHDRGRSQTSYRYSSRRAEDSSSSKFDERNEGDPGFHDDDKHKSNYRTGNFKRDNDYYTRQRYSDYRSNSHHRFKGAYSGRDGYANSYNSRNNRYRDTKDREQYPERNYREKRTYRDLKYKNAGDGSYNRPRQGASNYSEGRSERYSDRSYAKSSNNDSESLELCNQNENGDHDISPAKNGSVGSSNVDCDSSQREEALHEKSSTDVEKSSHAGSACDSSANTLPNAFCENPTAPRVVNPPPGFANPLKKVVYGLSGPPPGFNKR